MKINGPSGPSPSAPSRAAGRAAAPGFALGGAGAAAEARPLAAPAGAMSVSALLALQAVDDPLNRRRRAVGRAGRILDVLEDVKLALLAGGSPAGALGRLAEAVREAREGDDDPGLQAVLDQIETRAAVELAKQQAARSV